MGVVKLNEVYKPTKKYKVLVKTITFNQSKYIQDTLNGIALQKTNFPFVNVVLEDHSTDGEQDTIRLWLERECNMSLAEHYDIPTAEVIIAPHNSNMKCSFAVYFHKENLFHQKDRRETQIYPWRIKSDYEALCEGDDYWIDPYKLQKQVDFLESHHDYVMCCSDAVVSSPEGELDWCRYGKDADIPVRDMILGGGDFIQTASLLFRRELMEKDYPKCCVGDYPLQIFAALNGKVRWFAEKQVVYRFNSVGSWTSALRTRPLEQRLPMLVSEFAMLEQMNELSGGKYAAHFHRRIADHLIYIICLRPYRRRVDEILVQVGKYVPYFSLYQKFKLFLVRKRLFFILNIVKGIGRFIQSK